MDALEKQKIEVFWSAEGRLPAIVRRQIPHEGIQMRVLGTADDSDSKRE